MTINFKNATWWVSLFLTLSISLYATGSFFLYIIYSVLLLLIGVKRPNISISAYILIIPFTNYAFSTGIISELTNLIPVFFLINGLIINWLFHNKVYLHQSVLMLTAMVFILVTLSSVAYLVNFRETGLASTFLFFAQSLLAVLVASNIAKNTCDTNHIVYSLVLSALIVSVFALINMELFYGRLTLGGNVRHLANPVGISIVILGVFFVEKLVFNHPMKNKVTLLLLVLFVYLNIILIATISRGMILNTYITLALIFVFSYFFSIKNSSIKNAVLNIFKIVAAMIVLLLATYFSISFGLSEFDFDLNIIVGRFERSMGSDPRFNIWSTAISNMASRHWIVGNGVEGFRKLHMISGADFYAHSVFVDVLVSTGLLGFLSIILFLGYIQISLFKYFTSLGLGMFLSLVLFHLTHGRIYTGEFWLYLGICVGLLELAKQQKAKLS